MKVQLALNWKAIFRFQPTDDQRSVVLNLIPIVVVIHTHKRGLITYLRTITIGVLIQGQNICKNWKVWIINSVISGLMTLMTGLSLDRNFWWLGWSLNMVSFCLMRHESLVWMPDENSGWWEKYMWRLSWMQYVNVNCLAKKPKIIAEEVGLVKKISELILGEWESCFCLLFPSFNLELKTSHSCPKNKK